MRTIIAKEDMKLLGGSKWAQLFELAPRQTGLSFPSVIAARCNSNYGAAKCLRLVTEQPMDAREDRTIGDFCSTLLTVGLENIKVQFLAAIRPFTFFQAKSLEHLTVNYQIELPGGIVELDETKRKAALREAMEEGGKATTIQCASLMEHSSPFDAGSNVEIYGIETALVHATQLNPPSREGILSEHCALIPLLEAQQWLLDRQAEGIAVEGYALTALAMLNSALLGGWKRLS